MNTKFDKIFFILDKENEVYRIALKDSEIVCIDICKYKGKTIVIVNKKYADDAELIVGEIAIGFLGKI